MKKQFVFLIFCFILLFGLTAFWAANATDSPPFCTSYTYSDWSSCDPNLGSQERINTASYPAGCVIDFSGNNPAPITRQKCTYVSPVQQSASQPSHPQQPIVPPAPQSAPQPSQLQQSIVPPVLSCTPSDLSSYCDPRGSQDTGSVICGISSNGNKKCVAFASSTQFSSTQGISASTTPSTPQSSPSIQELFDQIKILQKQISELQSPQPGKQSSVSGNAPSDTSAVVNACVMIVNNLTYRSRDIFTNGDVSALQDFLQIKGYLTTEPSGFFGLLTLQAVKHFQADNNINPTGYVGSVSRGKIQQLTCK